MKNGKVIDSDNANEYPLIPSMFDAIGEQKPPFSQTFNVMPNYQRSEPIKVVY